MKFFLHFSDLFGVESECLIFIWLFIVFIILFFSFLFRYLLNSKKNVLQRTFHNLYFHYCISNVFFKSDLIFNNLWFVSIHDLYEFAFISDEFYLLFYHADILLLKNNCATFFLSVFVINFVAFGDFFFFTWPLNQSGYAVYEVSHIHMCAIYISLYIYIKYYHMPEHRFLRDSAGNFFSCEKSAIHS